jgi:cell division protein FtsW (lipid II flippase)
VRERHADRAFNFLPEHHTDFIFAVVGETYGFAGAALVLSLYALLIWRGLHVLTVAKNLYGALLAGGITGDAALPDLRQRGDDRRDHADHWRPGTPV